MDNRPKIKEELKREIRQEAYFGCVRCGSPIIQYHHIKPYAEVKIHKKENLVALCSNCHDEYHRRFISTKEIKNCKQNPFNKYENNIKSKISVGEYDQLRFVLGTNTFIQTENLIVVDEKPIIRVTSDEFNNPLIDAVFFDEENNILGKIVQNEWQVDLKYKQLWDFKYSGGVIQLNAEPHKPLFKLETFPDKNEVYLTTSYYFNGQYFKITPSKIEVYTKEGKRKRSNLTLTGGIISKRENGISFQNNSIGIS